MDAAFSSLSPLPPQYVPRGKVPVLTQGKSPVLMRGKVPLLMRGIGRARGSDNKDPSLPLRRCPPPPAGGKNKKVKSKAEWKLRGYGFGIPNKGRFSGGHVDLVRHTPNYPIGKGNPLPLDAVAHAALQRQRAAEHRRAALQRECAAEQRHAVEQRRAAASAARADGGAPTPAPAPPPPRPWAGRPQGCAPRNEVGYGPRYAMCRTGHRVDTRHRCQRCPYQCARSHRWLFLSSRFQARTK